jgi:hypothetical protein
MKVLKLQQGTEVQYIILSITTAVRNVKIPIVHTERSDR